MRIFTAVLGTETNTFAPLPTGIAEFDPLVFDPAGGPDEVKHPFAMVVRAVRERGLRDGFTIITGRGGFATPGGVTTRHAYETLRDALLADLRAAMPVDCVILGVHGAMIADGYDDAEGDLLSAVRTIIGPDIILGAELDPHGHLTELKCASADVLVCFKEYPHTDILERAVELVDLCVDAVRGKIRPQMSMHDCGMISMFHTSREPMRGFVDRMIALEGKNDVLSVSLSHGFPWGDCAELGTRVLVVTNKNKAAGDALARALSDEVNGFRDQLLANYQSPDAAIDTALQLAPATVVIADAADNPGGGAAGDSTFVLRCLIERNIQSVAFGPLWDAGAVAICQAAGVGARIPLRIGGKTSPASGDPLDVDALVLSLVPQAKMINTFGNSGVAPLGDAAAIRVGSIDIVLSSEREQALGDVFTPLGVEWRARQIVVVKSAQHFYAAYAPSAKAVLYAQSPASMTMDWDALHYRKRRANLWPFKT